VGREKSELKCSWGDLRDRKKGRMGGLPRQKREENPKNQAVMGIQKEGAQKDRRKLNETKTSAICQARLKNLSGWEVTPGTGK